GGFAAGYAAGEADFQHGGSIDARGSRGRREGAVFPLLTMRFDLISRISMRLSVCPNANICSACEVDCERPAADSDGQVREGSHDSDRGAWPFALPLCHCIYLAETQSCA